MSQRWVLAEQAEVPAALREAVGGHALVARLLAQRGLTDIARALAYLDPARYAPASPLALPGMAEAVKWLRRAVESGERVRVWGDFDADGQTATAVLYEALSAASARVDYRLPPRDRGHGLHEEAVAEALCDHVSTLVTCDTGINEHDLVARGVEQGLTVIITDHHDLPRTLPPAQAVVNPKMLPDEHPLHELSGVGTAYMVARALLEEPSQQILLEEMLDLVAVGLVADVAVQVADVRYLIQRGLAALRTTRRPGLKALARMADLDLATLDEASVGFQLAPRLNAAGRLADAALGVRLLTTRDPGEAQALAEQVEALNRDRQAKTEAVSAMAEERLRREPQSLRQPAIVLQGEDWEPGVLGSVAGALARRYDRPAVLVSQHPGRPGWASARSVEGVDIHQAILSQRELLANEGGGRPMAAGFSIWPSKMAAFRQGLWAALRPIVQRRPPSVLAVAAELPWGEVTLDLARQLARLAPFGAGNPRPVLQASGGILTRVEDVSRQRETAHRRLYLDDEQGHPLRLTWFNAGDLPQPGERLDVAFHLSAARWRGQERLDLELVDWRPALHPARGASASLVAGREVVDWRTGADAEALAAQLHAAYGAGLVVWAEGVGGANEDLNPAGRPASHKAVALAILTPPAGPDVLSALLNRVQPQVIYLLPPRQVPEPTPDGFVRQVAGMLRVALRDRAGHIDAARMAAHIGARPAAIIAALRGLEAAGKVLLRYEDDGLRGYLPREAPPTLVEEGNGETEEERLARSERAELHARQALGYLLRETRAYRQAYATQPVGALLG